MNKLYTLILLLCISYSTHAQIVFEKGYFITNSNNKTECLIKNLDWRNNPTSIKYKSSEEAEVQSIGIESIQEFGINEVLKYKRATVSIDRSSEVMNKMSTNRKPDFNQEQLLLKVLVEGKATLYSYTDASLERFFYQLDNGDIEQLIFKSYYYNQSSVKRNEAYKQQLLLLACEGVNNSSTNAISYTKKPMVAYFVKYNECTSSPYKNYTKKGSGTASGAFNLKIRPGISFASLAIENVTIDDSEGDFGNKPTFRLGAEAEFILPFNKNKWGIAIEPTFQYFIGEAEIPTFREPGVKASYISVEIPFSLRHYFYLENGHKLFMNAGFVVDFIPVSKLDFELESIFNENVGSSNMTFTFNPAFGVGYAKDKISFELRYTPNKNIINSYSNWNSKYTKMSLIFGYRIK